MCVDLNLPRRCSSLTQTLLIPQQVCALGLELSLLTDAGRALHHRATPQLNHHLRLICTLCIFLVRTPI